MFRYPRTILFHLQGSNISGSSDLTYGTAMFTLLYGIDIVPRQIISNMQLFIFNNSNYPIISECLNLVCVDVESGYMTDFAFHKQKRPYLANFMPNVIAMPISKTPKPARAP